MITPSRRLTAEAQAGSPGESPALPVGDVNHAPAIAGMAGTDQSGGVASANPICAASKSFAEVGHGVCIFVNGVGASSILPRGSMHGPGARVDGPGHEGPSDRWTTGPCTTTADP
jgi:hypothetical protein